MSKKRPDTFRGGDKNLIEAINALLDLDDANALVPHGLGKGSHAYGLLNSASRRLEKYLRAARATKTESRT